MIELSIIAKHSEEESKVSSGVSYDENSMKIRTALYQHNISI